MVVEMVVPDEPTIEEMLGALDMIVRYVEVMTTITEERDGALMESAMLLKRLRAVVVAHLVDDGK